MNIVRPAMKLLRKTAFFCSMFGVGFVCKAQGAQPLPSPIVCLGDSITDGNTYPQIMMQSMREAARPVPACICSGVGGDTARMMDARFEKTVAVFKPEMVTVSVGTNDAFQHVAPEDYGKSIRSIVSKAKVIGAKVILLTPCECLARNGKTESEKDESLRDVQSRLDSYELVIRAIAAEESCLLAEDRKLMKESLAVGKRLFVEDNTHPNYLGQSLIARSILDALECQGVALPVNFDPKPFPGLVKNWMLRLSPPDGKNQSVRLTISTILQVAPDATWKPCELPEKEPLADSPEIWFEQMRRNGAVLKIDRLLGKGKLVQGFAEFTVPTGGEAFIQTGMGIESIWLNGEKIHDQAKVWTGAHAGKERIPVSLVNGVNKVVIEFSDNFFLAVTPSLIWEDRLY